MKLFLFTFIFAMGAANTETLSSGTKSCFEKVIKEKVPTEEERHLLKSYLDYLANQTLKNSDIVIQKMQKLAQKNKGHFSIEWVSLFEGSSKILCAGESLGVLSGKILEPRVSNGHSDAIDIVLMYQKLASSDGADAENLKEYMDTIRNKHPKKITNFEKKYKRFK